MPNRFLVLLVALLVVAVAPGPASAHDLRAKVKLPGNAVVVEASFNDDTLTVGAKVVITNASGDEVAGGKTDERGVCHLPKLPPVEYVATVELIGHHDVVEFEVAESAGRFEFSNWRLDKRVGLSIGVGGLLAVTATFWWFRLKRASARRANA